jgi:formylglycine-generating enzyme required for sulfatase activity
MNALQEEVPIIASGWSIIPAGAFFMGENTDDKFANDTERPRHRVEIARSFVMMSFPVTVAEFRRWRPTHAMEDSSDWPVVGVSWSEAREYAQWLGPQEEKSMRLPSEAEWEYACRAGSEEVFTFGDTMSEGLANYLYSENGERVGRGARSARGVFPANGFGLYDMHGQVCEWTEDLWHPDYQGSPHDGTAWLVDGISGVRVVRGGAWDYLPRLLRSSWRDGVAEGVGRDNLGFRLVYDL